MIINKVRNIFKQKNNCTLSSPEDWFIDLCGDKSINISKENSLKISAVYACVNIRANTIAKMPIHCFKTLSNGNKEKIFNEVSYRLQKRPNPYMTPFCFKHTISTHLDLWGNAYVYIERDRGKLTNLWILNPSNTTIYLDTDTNVLWYLTNINEKTCKFRSEEILHFKSLSLDGLQGKSKISVAREVIGNYKSGTEMLSNFYKNGTTSKGVITHSTTLTPEAKANIKKEWQEANSGVSKTGIVAILDRGLNYTNIGMNFADAQFIELSKFGVEEIARIFNVPLHMLNCLDRSTFNNIQQQSLDFISNSIQPTLTDMEEEINYKLFADYERQRGYYVKFNMENALRGDSNSRADFYEKMLEAGVFSINEVRKYEDLNSLGAKGDVHRVDLNHVNIDVADKYQINKSTKEG